MSDAANTFISLSLSSDTIAGALVTATGDLQAARSTPIPVLDGVDAILRTVLVMCERLHEYGDGTPIQGIGLSTAGMANPFNGLMLEANDTSLELEATPLVRLLHDTFDLPIIVENQVYTQAMAEAHFGAGIKSKTLLYLFADDIVGSALIQNGALWHGTHASAGQIGLLVADWMGEKPITLNQRVSGKGIANQYNMRSRKFRFPSLEDITQYAHYGDQLAIRVMRDGARMLGTILSPVVRMIDPDCVVVGGNLAQVGDIWWEPFVQSINGSSLVDLPEIPIYPAQYTAQADLLGIAILLDQKVGLLHE